MAGSEEFDLESIAAFMDGRLSGAERDRVVKLLAESDDAFEVYADAVGVRADVDGGLVVSLVDWYNRSGRRQLVRAAPVAAAAALMIAVLPTMQARRRDAVLATASDSILQPLMAQSSARALAAGPVPRTTELAETLGPDWQNHWSGTRGAGSSLAESTTVLRLGVRVTDLRVALAAGDRSLASVLAGDMVSLLGSVDLSQGSVDDYERIRAQITAGDSVDRIVVAAAQAEADLGGFLDSQWFGLGKWFSAAEIAARAHSASFFGSSETERFLRAATHNRHLGPEDARLLDEVAAVGRRGVRDDEFESLRQKFADLIRRHGG